MTPITAMHILTILLLLDFAIASWMFFRTLHDREGLWLAFVGFVLSLFCPPLALYCLIATRSRR